MKKEKISIQHKKIELDGIIVEDCVNIYNITSAKNEGLPMINRHLFEVPVEDMKELKKLLNEIHWI